MLQYHAANRADLVSSSLENPLSVPRALRAPSVAAKLRLVARFAALAVLDCVAACALVEPIGIEPMT